MRSIDFTKEICENELININGGRFVKWWMFVIAPGAAYIVSKFEDGLYGE